MTSQRILKAIKGLEGDDSLLGDGYYTLCSCPSDNHYDDMIRSPPTPPSPTNSSSSSSSSEEEGQDQNRGRGTMRR